MGFDSRLDTFKTEINLVEYAGSCGYALVKHESSRSSVVMKAADGDKVVIAKSASGHWIYFSVHNGSDNGTIIDFVLNRKGRGNLGKVKGELSAWVEGQAVPDHRQSSLRLEVVPSSKDRQRVLRAFSSMKPVSAHAYLQERGIPPDVLFDPRFKGCVYLDARRNAVFPHRDEEGLSGYEIKNRGFTGFASGGEKALWSSNVLPGDSALVVAESAIDALSHYTLKRLNGVYTSTAGAWNPKTPTALLAAIEKLPADGKVVLAFDHDQQGLEYVERARDLVGTTGRQLDVDLPPVAGQDWNDVLKSHPPQLAVQHPHNRLQKAAGRGE
jgi:hypothetical protein